MAATATRVPVVASTGAVAGSAMHDGKGERP